MTLSRQRCAETGEIVESKLGRPEGAREDAILMLLREPRIVWNGNGGGGRVIEIVEDPTETPAEQLRSPRSGIDDTRAGSAPDAVPCQSSEWALHRRGRI